MTLRLANRITLQKNKVSKLTEKIGQLMSQRALEEEKLADLLNRQSPPAQDAPGRILFSIPLRPEGSGMNPDTTDGGQPFRGEQKVVLEKRTPDGKLDFTGEQPPTQIDGGTHKGFDLTRDLTFDDVYQMFFHEDKEAVGSWDNLRAWLDSKGWVIRAKTW
jgi:hypothetical protein